MSRMVAASRRSSATEQVAIGAGESDMRIVGNIVGVILVVFGGVWFLQGINVLPGSFMTGEIKWAAYGGIAFVAGVALLLVANSKRKPKAID
jgi:type IV secretory pathway VirB6-like protein